MVEIKRTWQPLGGPDPDTKAPRFNPPAGACDCHVHVYGPISRFPFLPSHAERSFEAPKEALETMHEKIAMDRCVIVHVPAHGTDLAVTLDAMAASTRQLRAVALVDNAITDNRLEELHAVGFRGVRYSPTLDGGPLDAAAIRRRPTVSHPSDGISCSISRARRFWTMRTCWKGCRCRSCWTISAVWILQREVRTRSHSA